jgi:EmrB/QacA subfamily drug resistance transporter
MNPTSDAPSDIVQLEPVSTVAPLQPDASDRVHQRRWWTLAAMCLSLLLVAIDNTILNVALPTLARELDASSSQLQWIVDGYVLVFAGLLLLGGTLGDRFGRRRALVAGLLIFAIASLGAAHADSSAALVVCRGVMGAGAALVMPATLSIITTTFRDPTERARAIGVWSGAAGLGVALGPVTGGWLLEHFWWGSAFLVNLPVIAIALLAAATVVPESRDENAPRIDAIGAALSIAALMSLLWAIIEAPHYGWTSTSTLLAFSGGAALLGAFVAWERRVEHPLLDVEFFSDRRFSASSAAIALVFFSLLGSMFLVTQYMQIVLGYSALESGVRYIPLAATMLVVAPVAPRLAERFGTKAVVAAGLGIVAAGMLLLARIGAGSDYGDLLQSQIVLAFGMALSTAPATEAIMGSLPRSKAGVGSAVNDTTRELGGALGIAVLGSLFASHYAARLRPDVDDLPDGISAAAVDSVAGAAEIAAEIGGTAGDALSDSATQAFVDGLQLAATVGAGTALAGAVIAAVWLPARAGDTPS